MKAIASGFTDKGMVRGNNEDNFGVFDDIGLFIVADGMGGLSAGEVASKMAVDVISDYIKRSRSSKEPLPGPVDEASSDESNRLTSGVWLANKVIEESALSNATWRGMGTTVVACYLNGSRLSVAHVGDSRVYLIRSGTITQITDDHSLVAEQLREGLITKEQAAESNVKNIITRALGKAHDIEIDLSEMSVSKGDIIVLGTDGLTNMVDDETILAVAAEEEEPLSACKRLVDIANQNGGKDNVTVVIVKIKGEMLDSVKNLFSWIWR